MCRSLGQREVKDKGGDNAAWNSRKAPKVKGPHSPTVFGSKIEGLLWILCMVCIAGLLSDARDVSVVDAHCDCLVPFRIKME